MLGDLISELMEAKTEKERERALNALEKVGVDWRTALAIEKEMTQREELRRKVEKHLRKQPELCEENGTLVFEIFASHEDRISSKKVVDLLGASEPEFAVEDYLTDIYADYADEVIGNIIWRICEDLGLEGYDPDIAEIVEDSIEVKLPLEHFMKEEYSVDLMIDTGDANFDYGCNSVYPYWAGERGSGIEDASALVWLAKTQGYTKRELEKALDEGDIANPKGFLETVRQEVANETSSMNCLTFLVRMTLADMIKVRKLMQLQEPEGKRIWEAYARPDCGTIKISKKATTGLYDPWYGAGSVFEIELERDIELPIKYIRSADPDGATFRWSVASIWGIPSSAWQDVVMEINEPEATAWFQRC